MIWVEFRQENRLIDIATAGTQLQMTVYTQPPVEELTVTGNMHHPGGTEEAGLKFESIGSGKYVCNFMPDMAGAYQVTVIASGPSYRPSTLTRNLYCKQ